MTELDANAWFAAKEAWHASHPEQRDTPWQSLEASVLAYLQALPPQSPLGAATGWRKPEYAVADRARIEHLARDPNDQMGALAAAVDAALTLNRPGADRAGPPR